MACAQLDASDHKPVAARLRWLPSRPPFVSDDADSPLDALSNPSVARQDNLIDLHDACTHEAAVASGMRATLSPEPVLPDICSLYKPLAELHDLSLADALSSQPHLSPDQPPDLVGNSFVLSCEDTVVPGNSSSMPAARQSALLVGVAPASWKGSAGGDAVLRLRVGSGVGVLSDGTQIMGEAIPFPNNEDPYAGMASSFPVPTYGQSDSCTSQSLLD